MAARGTTRDVLLQIISQFESKGVDEAKKGLLDLGKFDKRTFLGGLGSAFKGMLSGITGLLNPLRLVHGLLGTVGGAVHQLGGIFKIALGVVAGTAINTVVSSLKALITSPVEIAARVGALEVVFYRLGQQTGYAKDKLVGYVDALRETGITTRESLQNLTQMIQANLDLSKATDLARVAQDAAVIAGVNSSEAFSRLMHGIITLQPEILRGLGIIVDMQGEIKRYAAAHDIAAESISATTKQQIAFDAVLQAGQIIAGSYEEAMTEVGKKMTSIPRYAEEAALALGKGLKPILSSTVDVVSDLLKRLASTFETLQPAITAFSERVGAGLTALYEKGQAAVGALIEGFSRVRPYLEDIGEILGHYLPQVAGRLYLLWLTLKEALLGLASAVSTHVPNMAGLWTLFTDLIKTRLQDVISILDVFRLLLQGKTQEAGQVMVDVMANGLAILIIVWEDYVSKALTWGYNLVAEFANGMISAASEWITAAVDYVGNLIAGFFASFSPPKKGILRSIVEWGRGLINEYFKGFALADFSLLDRVGGMIKNALQSAVALGDLPEQELIPVFRQVRELVAGLIADFRKTGEISEEALGKIGEVLGEGSEEMVKYLRLQLEHQKALKDLEDVAKEYAEAEAAGFIPAELKEKLKKAQEAADAKAEELSWQEALVKAQQDSVDLQVQQVRVLQQLARALDKMTKATQKMKVPKAEKAEAAAPEMAAPTITPLAIPEIDTSKIQTSINEGLKTAFAGVSARFREAREKGRQLIENLVAGAREALTDLPGLIREKVAEAWDTLRERFPVIDELTTKAQVFAAAVLTAFTVAKDTILSAVDVIVGTSWPRLQSAFDTLTQTLAQFGISWSDVWNAIKTAAGIVAIIVGATLVALVAIVTGVINGIATALDMGLQGWRTFITGIQALIDGFAVVIAGWANVIIGIFTLDFARAWEGLQQVWSGGLAALEGFLTAFLGILQTILGTIGGLVLGFVEGIVGWFQNMYDRLVGGSIIPDLVNSILSWIQRLYNQTMGKITTLVNDVITKITTLVNDVITKFTDLKNKVVQAITDMVSSVLTKLEEFRDKANEILDQAKDWIEEKVDAIAKAFGGIKDAIKKVVDWLDTLIEKFREAWEWFQKSPFATGSPSPFEMSLLGITAAMRDLDQVTMSWTRTLNVQAASVPPVTAARGGNTYQFFFGERSFADAFPNVRTARDAGDVMAQIREQIEKAGARASVPGGVG